MGIGLSKFNVLRRRHVHIGNGRVFHPPKYMIFVSPKGGAIVVNRNSLRYRRAYLNTKFLVSSGIPSIRDCVSLRGVLVIGNREYMPNPICQNGLPLLGLLVAERRATSRDWCTVCFSRASRFCDRPPFTTTPPLTVASVSFSVCMLIIC